jgi:hypothetical protein
MNRLLEAALASTRRAFSPSADERRHCGLTIEKPVGTAFDHESVFANRPDVAADDRCRFQDDERKRCAVRPGVLAQPIRQAQSRDATADDGDPVPRHTVRLNTGVPL